VRCVEGSVRKVYGDLPRWIADSLADVDHEDLRA
jgi:hypothetical protein